MKSRIQEEGTGSSKRLNPGLKYPYSLDKPGRVQVDVHKSYLHCYFLVFSLFQVYPEMQNLFPEFRGQGSVEVLETTKFLNGHSKRLMTAVENSVNSLNDFESCSTYLQELGRRHKTRKLKPHYLEVRLINN